MNRRRALVSLAAAVVLTGSQAFGMSPAELRKLLDGHETVTVVDVRSPAEFFEAHVPGAMNVPASVLGRKRLPPLGRVVVCGDALRPGETEEAVAALNRMTGIRAEVLDGGMGAWEELKFGSTRDPGVRAERLRYATYSDVQRAAADGKSVVLVDLRRAASGGGAQARSAGSDLAARFPGATAVRPARERHRDGSEDVSTAGLGAAKDPSRVFVLVDDGNGDAEKLARRIQAAGLGQAVILAGGAAAVARDGQPGIRTREFIGGK